MICRKVFDCDIGYTERDTSQHGAKVLSQIVENIREYTS